jgi:hypothetical protein
MPRTAHLACVRRFASPGRRGRLGRGVFFVGSVMVSILVVAMLSLLLALAIPPIPGVRATILRIQQTLANRRGDSFILMAGPIQRAAIVSRVRHDLEWLISQRCRKTRRLPCGDSSP